VGQRGFGHHPGAYALSGDVAWRCVGLPWTLRQNGMSAPHVLIVEPDVDARQRLTDAARTTADVRRYAGFADVRGDLLQTPCDYLVTNLRLGAYNGIHLVYLVASHALPARCIVYTEHRDAQLAQEVQLAGAFYETRECLEVTLAAYLRGALPPRDRRAAGMVDRRTIWRGGRRCWDQHLLDGAR
jgi:DNA-binding NtrC family response regulator